MTENQTPGTGAIPGNTEPADHNSMPVSPEHGTPIQAEDAAVSPSPVPGNPDQQTATSHSSMTSQYPNPITSMGMMQEPHATVNPYQEQPTMQYPVTSEPRMAFQSQDQFNEAIRGTKTSPSDDARSYMNSDANRPASYAPAQTIPLKKTRKPIPNWAVGTISAGVAVILSLGLGWGAISTGLVHAPSSGITTTTTVTPNLQSTGGIDSWAAIAQSVAPTVVSIQTNEATGSGAIISTDGYIVTNNHVVKGASKISVTTSDNQIIKAKVVGTDPSTDLAVIKLTSTPKNGLKPVKFADSNALVVGQGVLSIGSPLGYANTATTGIVSAVSRPVTVSTGGNGTIAATNAIQIDAAINPGNSGGPTFNSQGEMIGINSSIATVASSSSEAGSVGIGFAIPSNLVKKVSDEIIKNGSAKHAFLGVSLSSQEAEVEVNGVSRPAAIILNVTDDTPASRAGLKKNDAIIAWNGNPVESSASVMSYVRSASIGDDPTITIVRNGKSMDVKVHLDKEDPNSYSTMKDSQPQGKENGGQEQTDPDRNQQLEDLLKQFGFSR